MFWFFKGSKRGKICRNRRGGGKSVGERFKVMCDIAASTYMEKPPHFLSGN